VHAASDLVVEVQTAPDPAKWGSLALSLLPFAPTVDGAVLPETPLEAITAGQGSEVPLMIGSNLDEADRRRPGHPQPAGRSGRRLPLLKPHIHLENHLPATAGSGPFLPVPSPLSALQGVRTLGMSFLNAEAVGGLAIVADEADNP
jgi:hypothetical protein